MKDDILMILAEVSLHEKDIETAQQELLDLFLVMQRISKCEIMYDVNGLYKVVNNEGKTIGTGNLQECVYYKEGTDALDGHVV
tara:strand:- start:3439 stop:3687 length:249 start_codon:yes stop_codon:yes gene_type:complete